MQGKARFRMVLVTKDGAAPSAQPAALQEKSLQREEMRYVIEAQEK
jgi:hypothetical protein